MPAVPDSVPALRAAVCGFARDYGVPEPPLGDVKLAVTEAITNVVVHSYRKRSVPGSIKVSADFKARELRLVVADEGLGMASRGDSPGLGLGLALIDAVADDFEIRPGDRRGTELHMRFNFASDRRPASEAAQRQARALRSA
jgi:serine/threonine-protein kinase RsbW